MGLSLKSIGGFLGKAVGKVVPYGDLALAGLGMIQGARKQGKADKMGDRQLAMAEQRYRDTAPLRSVGMERLLNTQRPDLSQMYQSENPFARPLRPLSPMMGGTTPRGPQAEDPSERPLRELTMPRPMRGGRF